MKRKNSIPAEYLAQLIAEGKTNKEIADVMHNSKRTVDSWLNRLYNRYQVKNRAEFIMKYGPERDSWNHDIFLSESINSMKVKSVPIGTNGNNADNKRIRKRFQTAFRRWLMGLSGSIIPEYIGADLLTVRKWVTERMIDGMTWNNYGSEWVIDHIVPLRMFDLTQESECLLAWNYRNLMPLFRDDNQKKEGNVFFAFSLLEKIKDTHVYYSVLYDRIKPEVETMNNYLSAYQV